MRAVVIEEFGPVEQHKIGDMPTPEPGPGEVLIDVHAIGVNFPDTLMMQGLYQTKPERPFTPGRDVAGVISAVGEGVTGIKPGDRVVAVVSWGAYAEQCVAPESRCFHIPDSLDFVSAAGMITTYLTAWVSLMERGLFKPGEKVLVLGASGGVGLAAVQLVKAKGGFVIGGSMSERSRDLVKSHGADAVIDLSLEDQKESLRKQVFAVTDGYGVDIVLDPIGGEFFDAAIRAMAFAGRIVVIGFVAGIPTARPNYFNVKNLTLAGMAIDLHFRYKPEIVQAAAEDIFALYETGAIKPEISEVCPLEDFQSVLGKIGKGKSAGKMVLTTGRG